MDSAERVRRDGKLETFAKRMVSVRTGVVDRKPGVGGDATSNPAADVPAVEKTGDSDVVQKAFACDESSIPARAEELAAEIARHDAEIASLKGELKVASGRYAEIVGTPGNRPDGESEELFARISTLRGDIAKTIALRDSCQTGLDVCRAAPTEAGQVDAANVSGVSNGEQVISPDNAVSRCAKEGLCGQQDLSEVLATLEAVRESIEVLMADVASLTSKTAGDRNAESAGEASKDTESREAIDVEKFEAVVKEFGTAVAALDHSREYFCGENGFTDCKEDLNKFVFAVQRFNDFDVSFFVKLGDSCRQATDTLDELFSAFTERTRRDVAEIEEDLTHAVQEHVADVVGNVEALQKQMLRLAGTHFSEFTDELATKEKEAMKAVGAAADGSAGDWLRYILYINVIQFLVLVYILKKFL